MYTNAKSSVFTEQNDQWIFQQHSRKLLMMDILMSETCWVHKKWNKIASDIKLVFYSSTNFDVLLTVHLSIILAIDQLNAQILFYNKFIIFLYMFRALLCSSSGGQSCIIQHLVSSHSVGGRPVHSPLSTCTPDGHLQLWRYQMLYNTIWPPDNENNSARNM